MGDQGDQFFWPEKVDLFAYPTKEVVIPYTVKTEVDIQWTSEKRAWKGCVILETAELNRWLNFPAAS